jgi:hypothetical protein
VVENTRGKNPFSSRFLPPRKSKSPPPKEGGVPHYLESQHPHGQPKQVHLRTHARIQLQNPASSFHPQLAMCPPVPARGAPWLAHRQGRAVAGPVGRTAPAEAV